MKVIYKLKNENNTQYLNPINTLNFQNDSKIFLSGTRDGLLKVYDPRIPEKCILKVGKF